MDALFPLEEAPEQPGPAGGGPAGPDRCRRCKRRIWDKESLGYHIGPRCRQLLGIDTPARRRPAPRARPARAATRTPAPGQGCLPLDAPGDDGDELDHLHEEAAQHVHAGCG